MFYLWVPSGGEKNESSVTKLWASSMLYNPRWLPWMVQLLQNPLQHPSIFWDIARHLPSAQVQHGIPPFCCFKEAVDCAVESVQYAGGGGGKVSTSEWVVSPVDDWGKKPCFMDCIPRVGMREKLGFSRIFAESVNLHHFRRKSEEHKTPQVQFLFICAVDSSRLKFKVI